NRNTGDLFFLGWGPALNGQGTIQPLFLADQTYSSYGNNKVIDEKIARAVTVMDPKGRAAAYAELQKLVHDEAPWVFLWQQHDLYGVASTVEWTPRADEKGATLMPGVTHAHVHICAITENITDQHRYYPASYIAARAMRRAEECLMQGFTTVRDAGGADYGFRLALEEGHFPGPRLLVSG